MCRLKELSNIETVLWRSEGTFRDVYLKWRASILVPALLDIPLLISYNRRFNGNYRIPSKVVLSVEMLRLT